MLYLIRDDAQAQRMLQLGNTPRGPREPLLLAGTHQQPIRQDRSPKGVLDPSLLLTPLVCPQAQVRLELPLALLHRPPALVCPSHLSRRPLVQSGHQDFRRFRAQAPPSFTQHHSDVADMPQTPACALPPEGFAACRAREAGHSDALRILARHMCSQVFERLLLDRFPCPGHGAHNAPAPGGILRITLQHPLPMLLRALRGIALHDQPPGPVRWANVTHHLPEQRIFRAILWRAFGPKKPKSHGKALHLPVGNPQDEAHPETPGRMLTCTPFWGQGILGAPLGFLTAIAHQMACPILAVARYAGLPRPTTPPAHGYSNSSPSAGGGTAIP
jgi:hypothetical protein